MDKLIKQIEDCGEIRVYIGRDENDIVDVADLKSLVRRYKAYEEALRHYADESNWGLSEYGGILFDWYLRSNANGFDLAQKALKETI